MTKLKVEISKNNSAAWAIIQPRDLAEARNRNEKWTIVNSVHLRELNTHQWVRRIRVRTFKSSKEELDLSIGCKELGRQKYWKINEVALIQKRDLNV